MSIQKSDLVQAIGDSEESTFVIGSAVLLRTVTYQVLGRISRISHIGGFAFLHLDEASWIPEAARWNEFINNGQHKEIEAVNCQIGVAVGSIVDFYIWNHPLPRTSK